MASRRVRSTVSSLPLPATDDVNGHDAPTSIASAIAPAPDITVEVRRAGSQSRYHSPTLTVSVDHDRRHSAPWRALALTLVAAIPLAAWGVSAAGDDRATPPTPSATTISPDLPGVYERLVDVLDGRALEADRVVPCPHATGDLPYELVADYLDGRILDTSGRVFAPLFC